MPQILVVDDDRTVLRLVESAFKGSQIDVLKAGSADDGIGLLKEHNPDAILLDIILPKTTGLALVDTIRHHDAKLPIIFITANNDSHLAIEAMKLGAYDYLLKPLDIAKVQDVVERALETRRLMLAPVHMQEAEATADGDVMVGRSPQMLNVYKQIGRVAEQDVAVLIRGASGTGKELVARAIYQHSKRKGECFLAVNCAALSDTLLESELFGHEKGAFTGADRRRIGKFEQCNGGTIFLDEIGDMSPLVQSKVLRILQEQKFERLGGTETIETDVRIISATNRDLEQMIEDGEFRLDLFHRLNAFEIRLPSLRERGEDIQVLIQHFLNRLNTNLRKNISGISDEALDKLINYPWPGNIRELQGVLRKAILMATGPVLVPELLPKEIRQGVSHAVTSPGSQDGLPPSSLARFVDERQAAVTTDLYAETLEMMERYLLTRILREAGGNQSHAAEILGITRGSLRHKIRALGIAIEQVVSASEKNDAD